MDSMQMDAFGTWFAHCLQILATVLMNWAPATMKSHCGHDSRQLKAIAHLLQLHDHQLYHTLSQGMSAAG